MFDITWNTPAVSRFGLKCLFTYEKTNTTFNQVTGLFVWMSMCRYFTSFFKTKFREKRSLTINQGFELGPCQGLFIAAIIAFVEHGFLPL